ncbi:MAG: RNA methyltransferase [Parcubacteria group bacterium SW_4_46_8]|nr:MAG: RNA methyltransferase [Parcubacteria group bacterium SW_4_46_8]
MSKPADNKIDLYVILHNIRSVYNVGSIFRTAEAVGATKIFCTGYTPTPTDRFGRKRDDFAKVALGAEEYVSWEKKDDVLRLIQELQDDNCRVVAAETKDQAVDYRTMQSDQPTAVVLGNEVEGIPQTILDAVDTTIEIPMAGEKTSLNVSVTAGIILFSIRDG